jgi:hypothetical protein
MECRNLLRNSQQGRTGEWSDVSKVAGENIIANKKLILRIVFFFSHVTLLYIIIIYFTSVKEVKNYFTPIVFCITCMA